MLSEETKIEVLHAHYVDTFSHIREALQQRDRLFVYIVIAVTIMLLQVVAPQDTNSALGGLISAKLGLSGPVSLSILNTILWFALLGIVVRYSQTVIFIERQYLYIHSIETVLASNYSGGAFTREGISYLSDYPLFSRWARTLYTILFPSALIVVLALKLITEALHRPGRTWLFSCNLLTFGAIATSVVLYLLSLHRRR